MNNNYIDHNNHDSYFRLLPDYLFSVQDITESGNFNEINKLANIKVIRLISSTYTCVFNTIILSFVFNILFNRILLDEINKIFVLTHNQN